MSKCPKCDSFSISGPRYLEERDVLEYYCRVCGYRVTQEPNDTLRKRPAIRLEHARK